MAHRFFSCCNFGSRRKPAAEASEFGKCSPDQELGPEADHRPQCSCKGFKEKGSCKHLPPPSAFLDCGGPPSSAEPATSATAVPAEPESSREGSISLPKLPELELPPFDAELSFGDVLGRGASGATVFRCTALLKGQDGEQETSVRSLACAAKVLPLGPSTFADVVEDFGREVDLMRTLQHPGLIEFLGACRICRPPPSLIADDAYVLCVELCDGQLAEVVDRRRESGHHFRSREVGTLLAQVIGGLAYLHERGVMHRDMKAANVFLQLPPEAKGQQVADVPLDSLIAKLGDFGACKVASRAQTPVQTPQWMAPEVVRQEVYGRPADIWGFGALAFELLELRAPYGDDITFPELEAALTAGQPPSLSDGELVEARCPGIRAVMTACFAPVPAERPTAQELLVRLKGYHAPAPASEPELPGQVRDTL